MTKFKSQGFSNTFKNARKGFRIVLKSEINIRIHVIIAFFVLLAAYLFDFSAVEYCLVLFAIALVSCAGEEEAVVTDSDITTTEPESETESDTEKETEYETIIDPSSLVGMGEQMDDILDVNPAPAE